VTFATPFSGCGNDSLGKARTTQLTTALSGSVEPALVTDSTAPARLITNFDDDAPLELGIVLQAVLVAGAEAAEVLADDA